MRRAIRATALSVLLGLLTSLAIAWAAAAFVPLDVRTARSPFGAFERWGRGWHVTGLPRPGATVRFWGDLSQSGRVNSPKAMLEALSPKSAEVLVAETRAELLDMQR